jgi:ribosome recycling factor
MIDETLEELQANIDKAHEGLKRDLSRIRTGRASPDILASLRIDYYGTPTPIQQMSSVNVPEPRLLVIKPWDKSQIKVIEKAIMESDLGLTPQNDGEIIRLPMPSLTEERRKELVKLAKKAGEESKVAIRKARHEAKDMIDSIENEGDASADDCDRARKKLEDVVQAAQTRVDEIVGRKEKDIIEI